MELNTEATHKHNPFFHVCPHAEWQSKGEPEKDESGEIIGKYDVECSCNKFDEVINKIERLKEVR